MSQQAGARRVTADIAAVDDARCTVLHVDMDAFFAAVELHRRPELRGLPMMVAGAAGRGVVLSATYEARAYGVRSAMPTARALALCPGITVIRPDHAAYSAASRAVMALFDAFTAIVEPVSVDEAFLDVSGARRTGGRPAEIAAAIRERVRAELGLTATVGVASTKFMAKLASTLAKPDGLLVVPPDEVPAVLRPLPVRALWGVGPKTADRLMSMGLATVGDIADSDPAALSRQLGRAHAHALHRLAHGHDERRVTPHSTEVTIGAERTFERDLTDPDVIVRELLQLSGKTGRRARRAALAGRTVVLKVRFDDFTTVTRSDGQDTAVNGDREIFAAARRAWDRLGSGARPVRLLGVRLDGLVRADAVSEQLELGVDHERPGWREAQGALDAIAERFPDAAPRPAALVRARDATARRGPGARP